ATRPPTFPSTTPAWSSGWWPRSTTSAPPARSAFRSKCSWGPDMSRRQKILVIGGLALLAMLYIGALANPSGSGSGDPDTDRPGIVALLGRWFGGSST